MRKQIKKYFVPHKENNYAPHLLREISISVLAALSLLAFLATGFQTYLLLKNSDFLAAVIPKVLVELANEDREDNEILPLRTNAVLEAAAQLKADDMAENGYFAHTSPDGLTPWHWFIEAGYEFSAAGENLAVNFSDSEDVEEAWMDSPGHRANILNNTFTEVGIATARGEYKGKSTVFVVQLFGRPIEAPFVPPQVALPSEEADEPPQPPEVAGETEVIPKEIEEIVEEAAPEQNLEVIAEDDLFIAVVDTNANPDDALLVQGQETEGVLSLPDTNTSFWERMFSQPRKILSWVYALIAILVSIALIFAVVIETERQHPKHVLYGVFLLALLFFLFYVGRAYLFGELLII